MLSGDEDKLTSAEKSAHGMPHIVVKTGYSIQAAVNAANAGTIIFIQPGTYNETVYVNKASIRLIGIDEKDKEIIIQNPGTNGNRVKVTSNGNGSI